MKKHWNWIGCIGLAVLLSGCTVAQQQEVLGAIGTVIPGSSTSKIPSLSSGSASQSSPGAAADTTTAASSTSSVTSVPATQTTRTADVVDLPRTDAQWVLQTFQRAMTDNPAPFQECLDNAPCKIALTAHLIQLQERSGGTLTLPPLYDRYDLKRGLAADR